jgi:hypothetical protein
MENQQLPPDTPLHCPCCGSKHILVDGNAFSEKKSFPGKLEFEEVIDSGDFVGHKVLYSCKKCGYHWRTNDPLTEEQKQALLEMKKNIDGYKIRRLVSVVGAILFFVLGLGLIALPASKSAKGLENLEVSVLCFVVSIMFLIFAWTSTRAIRTKKKFSMETNWMDTVLPPKELDY